MAYKKYIYRGEKKLGPYYYESYRDKNGKVKKRYLGINYPEKKLLKKTKIYCPHKKNLVNFFNNSNH